MTFPPRKPLRGGGIGLVWHSSALPESGGGVLEKAFRRVGLSRHFGHYSKYAGRIVAVSKGVKDFLSGYCKDGDKIVVVPTGVDVGRLHISFARPQSPFVFLAAADGQEGVAAILEAGGRMARGSRDFRIRLMGGAEAAAVAGATFRQKPEWLDIVGDANDNVPLYDSASCFVSAGMGDVGFDVIEASISGLPLIISNKEIEQGWNDVPSMFQFDYPDSKDLARKMSIVMGTDRERLARKCEISSRSNSAKYSLDGWANHIITIYRDLK